MSTTPRTDAAEFALHARWVSDVKDNGTYTLNLDEKQTRRFFAEIKGALNELERENAATARALELSNNAYSELERECARQAEEIARLREALERIAVYDAPDAHAMIEQARAALAQPLKSTP
jgi:septal ring factor EnvC (AmiA/AmiB activator)